MAKLTNMAAESVQFFQLSSIDLISLDKGNEVNIAEWNCYFSTSPNVSELYLQCTFSLPYLCFLKEMS